MSSLTPPPPSSQGAHAFTPGRQLQDVLVVCVGAIALSALFVIVGPDLLRADDPPDAAEPAPTDAVRTMLDEGWEAASRQPAEGERVFRAVLLRDPHHLEASYGLGYCLLNQGRIDEATQPLCTAKESSDARIRRDIDALLANAGLTCSP